MATLREWLTEEGFSFEKGTLVYHETDRARRGTNLPRFVKDRRVIDENDPILDEDFGSSYGSEDCPKIFGRDGNFVYFVGTHDGSTWLEKVCIQPRHYLKPNSMTPYV